MVKYGPKESAPECPVECGGGPIAIWAMPKCRGRQENRVFPMGTYPVEKFSIKVDRWQVVKAGFVWGKYQIFGLITVEFEFPDLSPVRNLHEIVIQSFHCFSGVVSKRQ